MEHVHAQREIDSAPAVPARALPSRRAPLHERVLALQAAAGNAAVGRLLGRRATARPTHASDPTVTEDVIPGGTTFVRGGDDRHAVDPNDVTQGSLNDCFVLAPLISIARFNPNHIMRMIRKTQGGWMVTLYTPTWWWYDDFQIFVSNRFFQRSGTPIYARTGDEITGNVEMWPMILEKAVAIAKGGSYANIDWGNAADIFPLLTGDDATERRFASRSEDTMLDDFVAAAREGRAASCSTKQTYNAAEQTLADAKGVINKHAYAFVGANRRARTVDLRDPNGVAHLYGLPIGDVKKLFWRAVFSDGYDS